MTPADHAAVQPGLRVVGVQHVGTFVREHLRELARGRQILCITHLPQVAAFAACHLTIAKDTGVTPARTTVTPLAGDGVVGDVRRAVTVEKSHVAIAMHSLRIL